LRVGTIIEKAAGLHHGKEEILLILYCLNK